CARSSYYSNFDYW
nr:immunoglobulin heavy chain junction region [Mus musculus]